MTEIELQAGYLYEYMRAHLSHIKLVEYNPDRLQRVKQQGLDKIIQTLQQYASEVSRERAINFFDYSTLGSDRSKIGYDYDNWIKEQEEL